MKSSLKESNIGHLYHFGIYKSVPDRYWSTETNSYFHIIQYVSFYFSAE